MAPKTGAGRLQRAGAFISICEEARGPVLPATCYDDNIDIQTRCRLSAFKKNGVNHVYLDSHVLCSYYYLVAQLVG